MAVGGEALHAQAFDEIVHVADPHLILKIELGEDGDGDGEALGDGFAGADDAVPTLPAFFI